MDGACRIPPAYIDRLEKQGRARKASGAVLLVTGLIGIGAGTGLTLVGNRDRRRALANEEEWRLETGNNDKYRRELDRAKGLQVGGGLLLLIGVPSTIAGIVLLALGTGKTKRAQDYRLRPVGGIGPDGFSVGFAARI